MAEPTWQETLAHSWRHSQDATNPADKLRWLQRVHRLSPTDPLALAALAAATLQAGDAAAAAAHFEALALVAPGAAQPGLAACYYVLGQPGAARVALARALQTAVPDPALAEAIAPGDWCGLWLDGTVAAPDGTRISLDGAPAGRRLPPGWAGAQQVECVGPNGPLVGSPLPVALTRLEAFADWTLDGVVGWAWYPADPAHPAVVTIEADGTLLQIEATAPLDGQSGLFRPRRFAVALPGAKRVAVRDAQGRHVLGSPLIRTPARPVTRRRRIPPATGVAIVIPVHGGLDHVRACLASVLATVPDDVPVLVIDDASPGPGMGAALASFGDRIRVTRLPDNVGFPGAANVGIRLAAGRDVVLLNSDTLVPPGWLGRLRAAAHAGPDIGSATPLSNDATILSVPDVAGGNPVPGAAATAEWDRLAQAANGDTIMDIPTGIGFCMYLRRDCLEQVGLLREDAFAQGYGEENDWCWRARRAGWRHVAALGVFVGHVGGQSFGAGRVHLLRRNLALLNRLHPGYDAAIAAFVAADPLAPARQRMDARRWADGRRPGAVVLITHAGGGGVDRAVATRCATLAKQGLRAIVLRPGLMVQDGAAPGRYPALRYRPGDSPAALLRDDGVMHIELHHRRGHAPDVLDLARELGVPVHTVLHDYAAFCQQIALTGPGRRYCGEPDVAGCTACVGQLGTKLEETITMEALLARSAMDLAGRVSAPSHDAARRIGRHFPGVVPVVTPWEPDPAPCPPAPVRGPRIVVPGAIGVEKGYDVLLACALDARARTLPLEFVVVGYSIDDIALIAAGVWVTGPYAEAEAEALIRAQGAALAFVPSIWPETWCYALTAAWQAGLHAAAFDLGAPAERIRANGRGMLLPLGLPAPAINDALLAAIDPARHRTEPY